MKEVSVFHKRLKELIIDYILLGYEILNKFPADERFAMSSQARRALVSILLNYVEGYARAKKAVTLNLYEISYGSLQESICVFYLACKLYYITPQEYLRLFNAKEEIAKMEWKTIEGLRKACNKKG